MNVDNFFFRYILDDCGFYKYPVRSDNKYCIEKKFFKIRIIDYAHNICGTAIFDEHGFITLFIITYLLPKKKKKGLHI